MKIVKRWGAILIGFTFLAVFYIVDEVFRNFELQMIFKWVCLIGALASFTISVWSDKKIRLNQLIKNKWVVCSMILSVIILIALIVLMLF